jgi:hypothetical protein
MGDMRFSTSPHSTVAQKLSAFVCGDEEREFRASFDKSQLSIQPTLELARLPDDQVRVTIWNFERLFCACR